MKSQKLMSHANTHNIGFALVVIAGLLSAFYFTTVHNNSEQQDAEIKRCLIATLVTTVVYLSVESYGSGSRAIKFLKLSALVVLLALYLVVFIKRIDLVNNSGTDYLTSSASGFGFIGAVILLTLVLLTYLERGIPFSIGFN